MVSLMAMMVMLALGAGLTLTTTTAMSIAANHRDGIQALYAAEAGVEIAIARLRMEPDWRTVAEAGGPFVAGRLADLLQSSTTQVPIDIEVSVGSVAAGDENVLVLRSRTSGPGAIRRNVEVMIRREPGGSAPPPITVLSWR